jgi:hypothetical protein
MQPYTSVLVVLSIALLLIASGLAKKQLVWKRPRPFPVRARRRRPRRLMAPVGARRRVPPLS